MLGCGMNTKSFMIDINSGLRFVDFPVKSVKPRPAFVGPGSESVASRLGFVALFGRSGWSEGSTTLGPAREDGEALEMRCRHGRCAGLPPLSSAGTFLPHLFSRQTPDFRPEEHEIRRRIPCHALRSTYFRMIWIAPPEKDTATGIPGTILTLR